MSPDTHRFQVGRIECIVVSDGTFDYEHPAQVLFANAPDDARAQALRAHGIDPGAFDAYRSPYNCLCLNTAGQRILVDTGAGALGPETGKLVASMGAAGIAPEDIDLVILTHGHADHVGGNLDANGQSAFPNARWIMSKTDWEFWTAEQPDLSSMLVPDEIKGLLVQVAHAQLRPLADRIELVDQEQEVAPGVRVVPAPGHTPGHVAVRVASDGAHFMHLVDTALHPIHLEHPDWFAAVDTLPQQTVATRRSLLARVAEEKAIALGFHFGPFPGLGRVIPVGDAWKWQPI